MLLSDLRSPAHFDALASMVKSEDIYEKVVISSAPDEHLEGLRKVARADFDALYIHNIIREQG